MVKVGFSKELDDMLSKPELDGIGIFIIFITSFFFIFPAFLNQYYWLFFLLSIGIAFVLSPPFIS